VVPIPFENKKEFTLERRCMTLNMVEKPSGIPVCYRYMKGFTLERKPIYLNHVVKL
jgi:hypothetical protein